MSWISVTLRFKTVEIKSFKASLDSFVSAVNIALNEKSQSGSSSAVGDGRSVVFAIKHSFWNKYDLRIMPENSVRPVTKFPTFSSYLITSIFFAFSAMQNEKSQKNPKKISAWMRSLSKERIFGTKLLVRITKSMEGFCVRKISPSRGAVALASHWTERSEGSGRG